MNFISFPKGTVSNSCEKPINNDCACNNLDCSCDFLETCVYICDPNSMCDSCQAGDSY